jgi:hypothetical protein
VVGATRGGPRCLSAGRLELHVTRPSTPDQGAVGAATCGSDEHLVAAAARCWGEGFEPAVSPLFSWRSEARVPLTWHSCIPVMTARARREPLVSNAVRTQHGPDHHEWGWLGFYPGRKHLGAPVLRDQRPIGRPGTAGPITCVVSLTCHSDMHPRWLLLGALALVSQIMSAHLNRCYPLLSRGFCSEMLKREPAMASASRAAAPGRSGLAARLPRSGRRQLNGIPLPLLTATERRGGPVAVSGSALAGRPEPYRPVELLKEDL